MGDADISWRKVHRRLNSHLLFFEDLNGRSSIDLEVIDSGITEVKDADGKKDMPWLAFRGAQKKFALNVTNCKTLESLCGTDVVSQWRGWITLVVVMTEYQDKKTRKREKTKALRIAPTRPDRASSSSPPPPPPPPPPPDKNTVGSGATHDGPASELTPPIDDDEAAAIRRYEADQAGKA